MRMISLKYVNATQRNIIYYLATSLPFGPMAHDKTGDCGPLHLL